ncbi:CinA family protein [Pseudomonas jilinensis]|uniref:Nicotinamide-nucleotide amidohydrolase family protein n=1 Tax=Pseudomonas jilinensis TaxID=2078689 RepID=A0A396S268_9PSED|nr:nicotinamide-nucleotide amidohydrolase family protein [Pseudomonas jilinensis]PAU89575.1 damage-inducible protein CinA [Pseudomonas sp. WN033]RHW21762.1 nicotinamide-nucleotide amidohydrolase family protein [Pseudomonas jilinensis]
MSHYDPLIDTAAARLGNALRRHGLTVTTAESCTGGGIAEAITRVSGSSAWFETGFVTYANASKARLLGVSESDLAEHGAVSEPVVRAMAQGALEAAGADLAVAVSGIAGPDGGSAQKPVGTVWFAWAVRGGEVHSECRRLQGNRREVRAQTVLKALEGLEKRVAKPLAL